ncbi:MAG: GGDEF domain-containing protein [Desulfobacterales bacterium]
MDAYYGRILTGKYSAPLKARIEQCILHCQGFDDLGTPAMPYISAWRSKENTIWYEFVSRRLIELLGCDYSEAPQHFRESIIERRRYTRKFRRKRLSEEILKSNEVNVKKMKLRREAIRQGTLDAVYNFKTVASGTCWIKDQATIEAYEPEGVYVSIGNLTVVTKEMEAEERLKETQKSLQKSEKKYRDQAIHDSLTRLYNTRYLYKSLAALTKRRPSKAKPFSLVFMDIDNFKQVVDTNGHLNASKTLREIAATIKSTLPEPAYGVAYGGDEFVVVLPGFDKQQALLLAETIRLRIRESTYLKSSNLQVHVSASLGIATFPDDADNLTDLLARADRAMFSVKEGGKDSICGISLEQSNQSAAKKVNQKC